ncbi:hypothetical protein LINPERHAP2_LOCUS16909 [Linum perenne]
MLENTSTTRAAAFTSSTSQIF